MGIRAAILLLLSVALPTGGNAQTDAGSRVMQPNASAAEWQVNSEPLMFAGLIFYPTRETRFFDPMVMTQVGAFQGAPLYADVTQQPYTVVYVPVGRGLMRAYEINPRRDLAATTNAVERERLNAVGTGGAAIPPPAPMVSAAAPAPEPTHVQSIPPPSGNDGVWIDYEGKRWYSDGPAAVFAPDRFTKIGDYRGFGVYRATSGGSDEIWIEVVKDGPLAPYARR
jgi:hypothetical protein